jgi:hypothetical protein
VIAMLSSRWEHLADALKDFLLDLELPVDLELPEDPPEEEPPLDSEEEPAPPSQVPWAEKYREMLEDDALPPDEPPSEIRYHRL